MIITLSITKGGPGSGFHGHVGRPGQVGGSTSGGAIEIQVNSLDDLRKIADMSLPPDDNKYEYFYHAARWPSDMDKMISSGIHTDSGIVYLSKDEIRDLGSGVVIARVPKGLADESVDVVEADLKYRQWTVDSIPQKDVLRSFREVNIAGTNHTIREDELAKYALTHQGEDASDLPEKYRKWFHLAITKELVEEKQLPISDAGKTVLIKIRTGIFAELSDGLSEDVYTGKISIGQWEESMKRAIRELHSSVAAIGKGGWDNMTWADWGRLGPVMKDQYRYLHGFAEAIAANKESISIDAIKARARMYGDAGSYSAIVVQAGDVFAKKLPWLPKDGSTECLVNCKCYWELIVIGEDKQWKTVQATWRLRPAEHCDDCIDRRDHVEVIQVYISVDVPPTIG